VIRNGKKIPLKFIEETICVRKGGGKVKECEPEKFVIRWVPGHGPLLNDLAPGITDLLGYISLRWAGFEPTREIPAILLVNHARNCDELFQGVRHFMVGEQNFVCIDREGNIAYIAPALLPIRPWNWQEYPPYLPLPGDGRFEWQGFYDYSWVPQVKNPKKGFIVTANNDPLGTTLDNNPTNDLFYHGHFYDLGARANRITELLKGYSEWGTKITLDHMALLQWDVKSKVADRFLPYLLSLETLFCSPDPSSELCEGFTLLKNWDRVNRTDSPGPTLFHLFLAHLFVETFSDEIPLFLNIMDLTGSDEIQALGRTLWGILNGTVSSDLWDRKNTPQREGFSDMAFSSLKKAIETGKETFRAEGGYPLPMTLWTWGKAHFVKFSHLAFDDLSFGPVSYHGGKNVVDASDFTLIGENGVRKPPYIQNDGPNMRLLIQFTPTGVEIRNILPGGAWEDPLSPHYTDQLLLWLKGEQKKVPYGKEEVEREKMEEYRYLPGMIRAGSP
jgi:penicillin amidase